MGSQTGDIIRPESAVGESSFGDGFAVLQFLPIASRWTCDLIVITGFGEANGVAAVFLGNMFQWLRPDKLIKFSSG